LDKKLTPADFPDPGAVEAARSRTEVIVGYVRQEQPTLRQLLARLAGARGHFTFEGTPEQVADLMEDWIEEGVADGFNLAAGAARDARRVLRRGRSAAAAPRSLSHSL
jgi:alkanesulfonate monooxygenase SsuD/methylene tetrahydromethanopterin reductase-like flavin-dependent oxidoreductase (luciferase family)